ncbi:MAG: hypothetical protein JWO95_700 [Verrucomicrobiales bacterium]|nr:hypothetical protein [Verrucomicrobiales bacterium]
MPNPNAHPQGKQHVDASGYEKRDASAKGIFLCVLGLLVTLVVVDLIVHWIYTDFRKSPTPSDRYTGSVRAKQAAASAPEFPRLQISPPADLSKFRVEEAEQLNTYGWVNQTAGVVRIPVERAMELVLQKGLPTRQNGQQGKAGPSDFELQQQRPNAKQPEAGGPR